MNLLTIEEPVFCLSCDTDWASDYALEQFDALLRDYEIRPTIFATGPSTVLNAMQREDRAEIGIHPNFLPGSTHGSEPTEIIDTLMNWFPGSEGFRCHSFVDSTPISMEMARRGLRYDSNLLLFLQPNLVPLAHGSGLVRYPVFWEDDVHWHHFPDQWELGPLLPALLSPGLKVLNVHPFFQACNIPNGEYYQRIKPHIQTLDSASQAELRHPGQGAETFLRTVLELLRDRDCTIMTLGQLEARYPLSGFLAHDSQGRPIGPPSGE